MPLIRVASYSFPVTLLYASHREPPDVNALAALDDLRADRIRKKLWKQYERLRAKEGHALLSEEGLAELEALATKLDTELRFERNMGTEERRGLAPPDSRRVSFEEDEESEAAPPPPQAPLPGTFQHELRRLAALRVEAEESLRGITLSETLRAKALLALEADPALREQAKANLAGALRDKTALGAKL